MTADRCMEGDRAEAERGCPREVDVNAGWKLEREAEDQRRRRRRGNKDRAVEQNQLA